MSNAVARWFLQKFAGSTLDAMVKERLTEAVGIVDEDVAGYRRLTANQQRDLPPVRHDRMLDIAHYLYNYNPFAKWLVNSTRDFIVSEGIIVKAKDPALQPVIDKLWHDPINRMPLKLPMKIMELGLCGEQCWPVFVNSITGNVRLTNVDPGRIKVVYHDPDNSEEPIGVELAAELDATQTTRGKRLRIIKGAPDEELFAPAAQRMRREEFTDGECFWFKVNTTSHQTRGISDLFALADWLDGYEDLMFNTRDRVAYLNAFCWDVTLTGMLEPEIKKWVASNPPPAPGTIFAHNEKIAVEAKAPDLQGRDNDANARLFRNHILGASNWPEHWYGGAAQVNRATAQVMDTPTFKALQARQLLIRYMIEDIVKYHLVKSKAAQDVDNKVTENPMDFFDVIMPRMDVRDVTTAASSLVQIGSAAGVAQDRNWISPEQAQRLFTAAASLVGVDMQLSGQLPNPNIQTRVTPEYRGGGTQPEQQSGDDTEKKPPAARDVKRRTALKN